MEQTAFINMTFDNRRNRVRIPSSVLKAIGEPKYIGTRFNKEKRRFLVEPVTPEEAEKKGYAVVDLLRVPDAVYTASRAFELQSQAFLPLMRSFTDWKSFAQYRVKGTIISGLAVFNLDEYDIIMQRKPLRVIDRAI